MRSWRCGRRQPIASRSRGGAANETILVVEDDDDVRSYSSRDAARAWLHGPRSRRTARAALHLLEANPEIRLLFTDIGLPGGMNGRQLAEEARKRRPDLKVLFTTGYARNAIVHDGRLDPGVELLTKPFTQARLPRNCATSSTQACPRPRPAGRGRGAHSDACHRISRGGGLQGRRRRLRDRGDEQARLIPGGVDAVVIDMGLPDRKGDALVREMRASIPRCRSCSPPARARPIYATI